MPTKGTALTTTDSNLFTLDSLREKAQEKFAPVKLGLRDGSVVTLRNVLMLSKDERETALDALDALGKVLDGGPSTDEDIPSAIVDTMAIVLDAIVEADADKLIDEIGEDATLAMQILETWQESSQLGEAAPSPN